MLVIFHVFLFFFFFKQKTAYEMRISDWSSDVCSSDLLHADRRPDAPGVLAARHLHRVAGEQAGVEEGPEEGGEEHHLEIGRASCRERVCRTCRSRWSPYH